MLPPEMKNHFLKSSGTILILFLKVCLTLAEKPVVVASKHPVIVFPGESVTLPCHLFPQASAVDLEVRWYRHRYTKIVHLYMFGRDVMNTQLKDYQGRTRLFKEELAIGNLSLQIKNAVLSDNGVYTCFAGDKQWDEQDEIELIVAALGTQPSISIVSTQGQQTQLVCRSEGWSPEPEVIWRDKDGNDVTSLSSTTAERGGQGLLSVSSNIQVKQQSNVFSCLLRSKIPKPDWESKLHISSDFFPGVSGWMVAFFLTLALSIGTIPLLVIQWRRMDEMEKKYEPKVNFLAVLNLSKELESMQIIKSEWKWIRGSAVDVTLDPDTAHPSLILSEDRKQVRLGGTRQTLFDNPERFYPVAIVLGRQGFTSGRHYWQVEVGEKTGWTLGVARESINRKGKIALTPKNGYWTVWLRDGEYKAHADPSIPLPLSVKPRKVGVYLDYEEGQLSFYNVETRSHIYTFTDTFTERLYPYFSPGLNKDGKNAAPLIILPVSDRD